MFESLSRLWRGIPGLLPSSCALCGTDHPAMLCSACRTHYLRPLSGRCAQCANPVQHSDALSGCAYCLQTLPAFDDTIAVTDYRPPMDRLILQLKFGAQLPLALLCATLLRDAALAPAYRHIPLPTVLTAVPISEQRLRERGFNQALEIAKPLATMLGVPLLPHLATRPIHTAAQSRLSAEQRYANVQAPFVVPEKWHTRLQGQHVGVVDDVMTTGRTLNALAISLKMMGASRVTNFVVTRTLAS